MLVEGGGSDCLRDTTVIRRIVIMAAVAVGDAIMVEVVDGVQCGGGGRGKESLPRILGVVTLLVVSVVKMALGLLVIVSSVMKLVVVVVVIMVGGTMVMVGVITEWFC